MSELSNKQRNSLNKNTFGIPSLRKYPLNDKDHVQKAIQMFHHCPIEYKRELAHNINKNAKKYDITISQNSPIYNYLNESEQVEIDLMNDIYLLEEDLYYNEAFGMNEDEARGTVDTAMQLWKKRKKFVQNNKDKQRLVTDIRNEKLSLSSLQTRNDYLSIIQRAKSTINTMNKKLSTGEYQNAKTIKGKGYNTGVNGAAKTVGKLAGTVAAGVAVGAVAGGALGKRSANNKGNGRVVSTMKKTTGAVAGAVALGTVGSMVGKGMVVSDNFKKNNTRHRDDPVRKQADRYINFVNDFYSEIIDMIPSSQQQNNEGEGEQ
jgi:hypothetical protein